MLFSLFSFSANANEPLLLEANQALANKQQKKAISLFKKLGQNKAYQEQSIYGLARAYFEKNRLDEAESHIASLLKLKPNTPDYLFLAGRIAGKQALSASIFSKIGYAKDTKRFFQKALEYNEHHVPSVIGLIKFHQSAPAIAGGNEDKIPALLALLKTLDPIAAFTIKSPDLLANGQLKEALALYQDLLANEAPADNRSKLARLKYDFAMQLAQYQHFNDAFNVLISISDQEGKDLPEYHTMRLYQLGKLAAEAKTHLAQGANHLTRYANLPKEQRSIPLEWVDFRLAQIAYYQSPTTANRKALTQTMHSTSDEALKQKIQHVLQVQEGE